MLRLLPLAVIATTAVLGQPVFQTLHSFTGEDGRNPQSTLTEVTPGVFYGTTQNSNDGSSKLYKITSEGEFTVLHNFEPGAEGFRARGRLCLASDGQLYGKLDRGGPYLLHDGSVYRSDRNGNVTVMQNEISGLGVFSSPIEVNGILYGTALLNNPPYSAVYVVRVGGDVVAPVATLGSGPTLTVPGGPLVIGSDQAFYGVGDPDSPVPGGLRGNVFRLTSSGLQSLFTFTGEIGGGDPIPVLFPAANGRLYGVTTTGGALGYGTLFSITTEGAINILHHFSNSDGGVPTAGLWQASDGKLYGTNGTLFRILPDGTGFETVYSFLNGEGPTGIGPGVVQGLDGKLYGTTTLGGDAEAGQVFSIDLQLPKPAKTPSCLP